MSEQLHQYFVEKCGIRDELYDRAISGKEPKVFFRCPKGSELRPAAAMEDRGKEWICWLISLDNPRLRNTGQRAGLVSEAHLWLAAHALFQQSHRIATESEIDAHLAAGEKRKQDQITDEKRRINEKNAAMIAAEEAASAIERRNAALREQIELEKELAALKGDK